MSEVELVFVVAVSSFTKKGFVGSASYGGSPIGMEFDDGDEGVFLTSEMSKVLGVKKGSKVLLIVDGDGEPLAIESKVAGVAQKPRISGAKTYYAVGREGGAIVRVRKG